MPTGTATATRNYRDLVDRIDRVSAAIIGDLGLGPGDHGAIVAANSIEYMEVVIGASQAGVALATVNPKLAQAEIVAICDDAKARVVFSDAASAEALKDSELATAGRIIGIGQELEDWLAKAKPLGEPPESDEWGIFTIPYTSGHDRFGQKAFWYRTGPEYSVCLQWRSNTVVILRTIGSWPSRRCVTAPA